MPPLLLLCVAGSLGRGAALLSLRGVRAVGLLPRRTDALSLRGVDMRAVGALLRRSAVLLFARFGWCTWFACGSVGGSGSKLGRTLAQVRALRLKGDEVDISLPRVGGR